MMVETILDTSQDFGMSNGSLPQWKRELLQRRAARGRPAPAPAVPPVPPPPPPPPPPPADEDDEELRYGPGIVKRLKSRYLSLAMREAPRRRPSVLRRAASLEHLIEERPAAAPRPARSPRPASVVAAPPPYPRRDLVKRARSVDALSRLEEAPAAPAPPPPPPRPSAGAAVQGRAARPPRRPAPLLRDAERPPPDVVRTTLRKFQRGAPAPRSAPAARVSAVVRGLEAPPLHRSVTPEREPSPLAPALPATPPPPASPAASTPNIERSPSPTIEQMPTPPPAPTPLAPSPAPSPLPARPVSPMAPSPPRPAAAAAPPSAADARPDPAPKEDEYGSTLSSDEVEIGAGAGVAAMSSRRVSRAALEGIARAGSSVRYAFEASRGSHLPGLALAAAANPVLVARRVGVIRPMPAAPLANGHRTSSPPPPPADRPPWARAGAAARPRAPPAHATSIVFNFSARKEVPDYIENDGIVLRGSRRPKIKAGETGVVWVRGADATAADDSESEGDGGGRPPSPLRVRFVNDNVLINGRSSMPSRPDRQRQAKLKLQFDDSLTRTHEYPSETSLVVDDSPVAPAPAPAPGAPAASALADNTHIVSAALSRYAPSKTCAAAAPLGLAPQHAPAPAPAPQRAQGVADAEDADGEGDAGAGACAGDQWEAAPWSAARALTTDMLF